MDDELNARRRGFVLHFRHAHRHTTSSHRRLGNAVHTIDRLRPGKLKNGLIGSWDIDNTGGLVVAGANSEFCRYDGLVARSLCGRWCGNALRFEGGPVNDNVLEYAAPQARRTPSRRSCLLFLLLAALIAVVFWCQGDWWAYVAGPNGVPRRKFPLPIWYQVTVSGMVGWMASTALFGIVILVRWLARGIAKRWAPSSDP